MISYVQQLQSQYTSFSLSYSLLVPASAGERLAETSADIPWRGIQNRKAMTSPTLTIALLQALLCVRVALPAATHYSSDVQASSGTTATLASAGSAVTNDPPKVPIASRHSEYKDMVPTWMKCAEITGVTRRLETLPGTGWDSLTNTEMGFIMDITYDKCQTTPDGLFLIPDNVIAIPLQRSEVQRYADLYTQFTDYRSATAHSMSLDISFSFLTSSFSYGYQTNKENMYSSKSATTRTQIRHELYQIEVKPDAKLTPALKSRLLNIAALQQNRFEEAAYYEMDLIIRDYGTHMIKTVVAGGAFVHEDQVRNEFINNKDMSSTAVKAAASASFMVTVGFQFQYSTSTSNIQQYLANVTQSTTRTFGGPPFRPGMTVADWEKGLLNALVPVDRRGDPIEYAISSFTLSELPTPTVRQIGNGIEQASRAYSMYNTHVGCLDITSRNFDYQANSGDKTYCQRPPNNYTFGGVYQTCTSTGHPGKDVCSRLQQKNPLSGSMSCPPGYEAVLLHKGKHVTNWNEHKCDTQYKRCGFLGLSRCGRPVCRTDVYATTAMYEMHWCVKLGKVDAQAGYLFGGIYSQSIPNPVTETMACPKFFYPLRFGDAMGVCISNNYERGFAMSVPFAGLFSCSIGNPLSLPNVHQQDDVTLAQVGYGNLTGTKNWPRRCPEGYSQHLAAIDYACEINYCVRTHAFDRPSALRLRRPPYGDSYPSLENESVDTTVIVGPSGLTWTRNSSTGLWEKSAERAPIGSKDKAGSKLDKRAIAGIAAGGGVMLLLLIGTVIMCSVTYKLRKQLRYKRAAVLRNERAEDSHESEPMRQRLLKDDSTMSDVRLRDSCSAERTFP